MIVFSKILLVLISFAVLQAMNAEANDDVWQRFDENSAQGKASVRYYDLSCLDIGKFLKRTSGDEEPSNAPRYYRVSLSFGCIGTGCSSCFPLGFLFSRFFRVHSRYSGTIVDDRQQNDGAIEIVQCRPMNSESGNGRPSSIDTYNVSSRHGGQIDRALQKQEELQAEWIAKFPLEKKREIEKGQKMLQLWQELSELETALPNDSNYDNNLAAFISLKILGCQIYHLITKKLKLPINENSSPSNISIQMAQELVLKAKCIQEETRKKMHKPWWNLETDIREDLDNHNTLATFIALKILTSRLCPLILKILHFDNLGSDAQIMTWLEKEKSQITLQLWEELYR